MKTVISTEERNRIVVKHLPMIDKVMNEHRNVVRIARMEKDDIYQQLAERMINAVDAYDAYDGEMEGYLETQLEFELFNCAHPRRSYARVEAQTALIGNRATSFEGTREASEENEGLAA